MLYISRFSLFFFYVFFAGRACFVRHKNEKSKRIAGGDMLSSCRTLRERESSLSIAFGLPHDCRENIKGQGWTRIIVEYIYIYIWWLIDEDSLYTEMLCTHRQVLDPWCWGRRRLAMEVSGQILFDRQLLCETETKRCFLALNICFSCCVLFWLCWFGWVG